MKKMSLLVVSLATVLVGCAFRTETPLHVSRRPNFLVIISDDQRDDTLGRFMPITQARIFDDGVTFTKGYVTTPLCCPSRSSILTGMYASAHGVHRNQDPLEMATFVQRLHDAGYYTGLIGKYLNSWDGSARPEFDFWAAFAGKTRYFDPPLNVNGLRKAHQGYITTILQDYALRFLREAAQHSKPFALIFAPNAPHLPANPLPGDESLYPDLSPHRPPNYNEADVSDKPRWLWNQPPLTPQQQEKIDADRRKQLQTLRSLDLAIGAMLDLLQRQGRLDDTVIFYISDNGFLWGEHRLRTKNLAYEPAIHVPFAMRYPALVSHRRVESRLVANIDIAPTIYDLAGLPIPKEVNGRSLVPLLRGQGEWRDDLLIEGWGRPTSFMAVHTGRYVYVETVGYASELYDLERDPYQLENRVNDPAYATVVGDMRQRLQRLRPPSELAPADEVEEEEEE